MNNYYITENNKKIEIIDKETINLSYKNIKEIYISDLPNCEMLDLYDNNLTIFNINLPNCETLYLYDNNLTSFKANLSNIKYLYLFNKSLLYKRINNELTFYI